jgi:peptide/nickel transport system substrate-binding protein
MAGGLRGLHRAALAATLALCVAGPGGASAGERRHAIAMHGEPALAAGFAHLPHVNPAAPKGGRLTLGFVGSFDSLNPFIVRGQAAGPIRTYVYESLLIRNPDEPFSLYGHLAESIEVPDDRSSITFHLNPNARFSDGRPVTVDDVVFSWEMLKTHGWPNLRLYYGKVEQVERLGERSVRFSFPGARDRELPLIIGLMPVLPSHALARETFDQTTLEPPVGSGAYVVSAVDQGAVLTLRRNPDWWARDLATGRGLHNFDELRFEYYRDANSMLEAFKKGLVDVRWEDDPVRWATAYDFPAVREGRVVLEAVPAGAARGMYALVMNTRRPVFADRRVRAAMLEFFDFEWINANLFAGGYRRTSSFFEGSELSSVGHPASERERELLAPFMDRVTEDALAGAQRPPVSDGSGFDRTRIRRGLDLLRQAGWTARNGRLVDASGQPFVIEAMVLYADQERLLLAWKRTLDRVGIELRIRRVDSAQWERRRQTYDYDLMGWAWAGTLSPGNEQAFRWGSRAAEQPGSLNLAGVREPAIDAMVEATLAARSREELVAATRALDRLLISGTYVLPLYHSAEQRIARWVHVEHPPRPPLTGISFETWWRRPEGS